MEQVDGSKTSLGGELHISNLRPGRIKSSLFSAIMLAYWDNVMGPMITKVWKGNDKVEINEEIINYVSNHTLSGELCRQTEKNTIDPKLYVLSDLGYIFFAVIFNGHSKMGQTISSLSFIMPHADVDRYLYLHDFINRQVKLMIVKYRILQRKDLGTAVKVFSSYLKHFVRTIDSLQNLCIPENICINDTIFGESEKVNDMNLLDIKFLMMSLTSHLQTCGCTIVIGRSPEKINSLIKTLALFLSTAERYSSRYACGEKKYQFSMDLWMQGIIDDPDNIYMVISSKDILLNTFPVTLINVDEKTIQQTCPLNQHGGMRKDFLKGELGMLLHGSEAPIFPYHQLFTDEFGDISMMVQRFITELFAIPNKCSIRKNHIANFISLLGRKSQALLSYVEDRSEMGKEELTVHQLQQLKRDLCINSDSDFRIILAAAEKLHPGLAVFLTGDDFMKDREIQAVNENNIMVIRWLRTILSSSKKLIASDHLGNKYYEAVKASGKIRRFVDNDVKPEDYSSGELPLEWEAWIRGKRSDPPTQQEIDNNVKYASNVLRRAAIKTREDDQKQAKALADGLIMRERTSDNTPAKQAMAKKMDTRVHASTGVSYQPDAWKPEKPESDASNKYEPEAWTPGGSSK